MPILDGQAVLYSFESISEVRIGVAFGSGSNQSLPTTELLGVSSWLVKLFANTLVKTMVEPRRHCYSLPPVDLKKDAVGGILSVTVSSASELIKGGMRGSYSGRQNSSIRNANLEGDVSDRVAQMFVEVELRELTRRTSVSAGSDPRWDTTFKMVLHENTGVVRFNLYEWVSNNVKHDYITSYEIKAIGPGSSVLTKRVESVGQEVEMVVPFEEINSGEWLIPHHELMPHLRTTYKLSTSRIEYMAQSEIRQQRQETYKVRVSQLTPLIPDDTHAIGREPSCDSLFRISD
ncbi:hypothetical protein GIB67_013624 [Kingdonia uniflora]|uniref:C2 domain-containing protein n=1 Tax=Kingdonia uniflora TaxID=39325 RepID=A0A7J7NQF1_9MAGN|nr:hypothetical protein GIB67_013624 [Kingdonia uniflora]